MAWIKMDHSTGDKPEIYSMAENLNIDPDAVIGKLYRIWVWADQQTVDGYAPSVTTALLDRLAHHAGFTAAMEKVGWLKRTEAGIHFSNFERHNGESAKQRSLSALRMQKHRAGSDSGTGEVKRPRYAERDAAGVTNPSPDKRRVEEIREELKEETPTPFEKVESKQTALPGAAPAELGGHGDSFELKSRKKSTKPVAPLMIPDVLAEHPGFAEAWAAWERYKREAKKELTPSTRNKQLEMLARHGPVKAIAMMQTSITNGWAGLFPDDATNGRKSGKDTRSACITRPDNIPNHF